MSGVIWDTSCVRNIQEFDLEFQGGISHVCDCIPVKEEHPPDAVDLHNVFPAIMKRISHRDFSITGTGVI